MGVIDSQIQLLKVIGVCVGGGRGGEGVVGEESSKSMVPMLSSLNKGFLCFLTIVSNKKKR